MENQPSFEMDFSFRTMFWATLIPLAGVVIAISIMLLLDYPEPEPESFVPSYLSVMGIIILVLAPLSVSMIVLLIYRKKRTFNPQFLWGITLMWGGTMFVFVLFGLFEINPEGV